MGIKITAQVLHADIDLALFLPVCSQHIICSLAYVKLEVLMILFWSTLCQGLEHAIAGTALYVVKPEDDLESVKELAMDDIEQVMSKKKDVDGDCVSQE